MNFDPLGVGAFHPGAAGAGAGGTTTAPVVGITMGPPALSIPHATADPGTARSITPSSAITSAPSTSSTSSTSSSTASTSVSISTSTSTSADADTDTDTGSGTSKMVTSSGNDGGRTMPVYTDVRTTGTPRVDSYGAAAAVKAVTKSNGRGLPRYRVRGMVGIGTALIMLIGVLV